MPFDSYTVYSVLKLWSFAESGINSALPNDNIFGSTESLGSTVTLLINLTNNFTLIWILCGLMYAELRTKCRYHKQKYEKMTLFVCHNLFVLSYCIQWSTGILSYKLRSVSILYRSKIECFLNLSWCLRFRVWNLLKQSQIFAPSFEITSRCWQIFMYGTQPWK